MLLVATALRRRAAQLVRYATVSAVATAVGLTTLALLVGAVGMPAGWANVIATAVGTVPSFELNRRWVWRRSERPVLRQAVPFLAVALGELAVSTVAVRAAAGWASSHDLAATTRTGVVLGANLCAFGSLWVLQFVLCDRLLFGRRAESTGRCPC